MELQEVVAHSLVPHLLPRAETHSHRDSETLVKWEGLVEPVDFKQVQLELEDFKLVQLEALVLVALVPSVLVANQSVPQSQVASYLDKLLHLDLELVYSELLQLLALQLVMILITSQLILLKLKEPKNHQKLTKNKLKKKRNSQVSSCLKIAKSKEFLKSQVLRESLVTSSLGNALFTNMTRILNQLQLLNVLTLKT